MIGLTVGMGWLVLNGTPNLELVDAVGVLSWALYTIGGPDDYHVRVTEIDIPAGA